MDDVTTIAEMMCKTGEKSGGDPFWENSAVALVKGVIMHLLYKHYQEGKDLPNPSDVMSFLSSPDMDTDHLFANMKIYPHISSKEFLELEEWENVLDENGDPVNYEAAVALMDDDLREELHRKMSPCSNQKFFDEYAKAHKKRFGEDFAPAVDGEW
jgi:hypothetical protein